MYKNTKSYAELWGTDQAAGLRKLMAKIGGKEEVPILAKDFPILLKAMLEENFFRKISPGTEYTIKVTRQNRKSFSVTLSFDAPGFDFASLTPFTYKEENTVIIPEKGNSQILNYLNAKESIISFHSKSDTKSAGNIITSPVFDAGDVSIKHRFRQLRSEP